MTHTPGVNRKPALTSIEHLTPNEARMLICPFMSAPGTPQRCIHMACMAWRTVLQVEKADNRNNPYEDTIGYCVNCTSKK